MPKKGMKLRGWTTVDIRMLKTLAIAMIAGSAQIEIV
jgi:hypothetical protein